VDVAFCPAFHSHSRAYRRETRTFSPARRPRSDLCSREIPSRRHETPLFLRLAPRRHVTSRHVASHAFLMLFYTLILFFFFPPYPLLPRSRVTRPLRSWGITECRRYMAREREPENGFPKRAGRDEAEARRFPSRCLLPYSEAPSTPVPKLLVYPRRRARPVLTRARARAPTREKRFTEEDRILLRDAHSTRRAAEDATTRA